MKLFYTVALAFILAVPATAQSLNEYQYVVVPAKFGFQSKANQYRLSTILKTLFGETGITPVYSTDIMPAEIASDRCNALYADVVRESGLLMTKLSIVLRDCANNIVFKSAVGSSKEKGFEEAQHQALKQAFESVRALNYKYQGKSTAKATNAAGQLPAKEFATVLPSAPTETVNSASGFSIESVGSGYLVIDQQTSVVKYRLYYTSAKDIYLATSDGKSGIVHMASGEWVFEYYLNNGLHMVKTGIKLP